MDDGDIELVKMSDKGQLVVPLGIRESLNLNPGERFVALEMGEGVYFKKVDVSSIKKEFEKVSKEVSQTLKKSNVTRRDLKEAISWARKKS
jgi:AbrB family looped-hinge helix DNA binding protein